MSIAISFKLCTYFTFKEKNMRLDLRGSVNSRQIHNKRSVNQTFCGRTLSSIGIKKLRPGSRIVLNLPILSTSQASCWGTNITPMFTGVPVDLSLAPEEIKEEVGRRGRGPVVQLANNRRPKRAPRCRDIADWFLIRSGKTFVCKSDLCLFETQHNSI